MTYSRPLLGVTITPNQVPRVLKKEKIHSAELMPGPQNV